MSTVTTTTPSMDSSRDTSQPNQVFLSYLERRGLTWCNLCGCKIPDSPEHLKDHHNGRRHLKMLKLQGKRQQGKRQQTDMRQSHYLQKPIMEIPNETEIPTDWFACMASSDGWLWCLNMDTMMMEPFQWAPIQSSMGAGMEPVGWFPTPSTMPNSQDPFPNVPPLLSVQPTPRQNEEDSHGTTVVSGSSSIANADCATPATADPGSFSYDGLLWGSRSTPMSVMTPDARSMVISPISSPYAAFSPRFHDASDIAYLSPRFDDPSPDSTQGSPRGEPILGELSYECPICPRPQPEMRDRVEAK